MTVISGSYIHEQIAAARHRDLLEAAEHDRLIAQTGAHHRSQHDEHHQSESRPPKEVSLMSRLEIPDSEILWLLAPGNCALALIDYQPQPVFHIQSIDRQLLINNVTGLAKTARLFEIPTVVTTILADEFAGPLLPELRDVFPDAGVIDRSSMNAWQDAEFRAAVKATRRRKLIMAGIWTEVCLAMPALSARAAGYEVYFVVDAVGGVSTDAHTAAVQRLIQAGAVPISWIALLQELQRDWSRTETAEEAFRIGREHGGSWGQGIVYHNRAVA